MGLFQEKKKLILLCCAAELAMIALIALACLFENFIYYLFYNLLYGLAVSVLLPLWVIAEKGEGLEDMGLKKLGGRQVLVLCAFCLFSVGGRVVPRLTTGESLRWERLPVAVLPLMMTTFFEEFFFRGFVQTRLERQFGSAAAVAASGLLFSLYHLGYPGFRSAGDLALLFAVGVGFALAFRLSGNNFFVSYFVNLPNAFLTYILKQEQFPHMTAQSTVWAGAAIAALAAVLLVFAKRRQAGRA